MAKQSTEEHTRFEDVRIDDVVFVYSGEEGMCKCGCSGTYSYHPKHQILAGEARGYPVKDEALNLAEVERILTLFQQHQDDIVNMGLGLFILTLEDQAYTVGTVQDATWWKATLAKRTK